MTGRRTNLALLMILLASAASGIAAFAFGTSATGAVVVAHGVTGLGIVVLAPWKAAIARKSIQRRGGRQWMSIALAVSASIAFVTGVSHSSGLLLALGPLTTMQIHVGSGVAAVALGILHMRVRPVRARVPDSGRRDLLLGGGLLAVSAALYWASESLWSLLGAPGTRRRFTGSHERGASSEFGFPVTQWLNDRVAHLDGSEHRVKVQGRELTPREIASHGDAIEATLDCTGGWFTTQSWRGARLDRFLAGSEGNSILVRSVTGYWRRFPIDDAASLLLCTHIGETPLDDGHGAPVRLVAPGRRGFWWVKWVEEVSVDDRPWWWQPPLPTA